jgi:CDK inhibitor PHO81
VLALCRDQCDRISKNLEEVGQTLKVDHKGTVPRPPGRHSTRVQSPGASSTRARVLCYSSNAHDDAIS